MILVSIVLFCLSVIFGLSLVVLGLRYRRSSLIMAIGHAGIAVLGLGFLGKEVLSGPVYMLYNLSALLFVFALFGGLVLLGLRISKREHRTPPPMFVVGLHALMAVIALLLLVTGYLHR